MYSACDIREFWPWKFFDWMLLQSWIVDYSEILSWLWFFSYITTITLLKKVPFWTDEWVVFREREEGSLGFLSSPIQDWSNIQLKNCGQNSLMSHAGMYEGIISTRSIWASNRGQQVYDMRTVRDSKNLGFEKKPWVGKKTLSFVKNLSFETIWVFNVFVHHHLIVKGNIFLRFYRRFGRIGCLVMRASQEHEEVQVVAVNHRRPRRSINVSPNEYINIHMDKLMRRVVETPMN